MILGLEAGRQGVGGAGLGLESVDWYHGGWMEPNLGGWKLGHKSFRDGFSDLWFFPFQCRHILETSHR